MTITPTYGSPTNHSLSSPDYDSDSDNFTDGRVDYTYDETFQYAWVPDPGMTIQQDPPVDETIFVEGLATLDLFGTSGCQFTAGSGDGSIDIGGDGITATYSCTPPADPFDPNQSVSVTEDGVGTAQTWVEVTLTGATGSFARTYSGYLDTGTNGVVQGHFAVQLTGTPQKKPPNLPAIAYRSLASHRCIP